MNLFLITTFTWFLTVSLSVGWITVVALVVWKTVEEDKG